MKQERNNTKTKHLKNKIMTLQEKKAMELISKFVDLGFTIDSAKQCSLIVVDEILNLPFEFESERKYWKEVKQEIEKL